MMNTSANLTTCPWSGKQFPRTASGGNEKVFASKAIRFAAHKAARRYGIHLVETDQLTWAELRRWSEGGEAPAHSQPARCTSRRGVDDRQIGLGLPDFE